MNLTDYRNNVKPDTRTMYEDDVCPDAIILEGFNSKYNCESFALHGCTTEWKWSDHTLDTLAAKGFQPVKVSNTRQGDLVVVEYKGIIKHYCRIVETNEIPEKIRVISKFGKNELAIVNLENSIGGGYGNVVTFLRHKKEGPC